jgi:predicted benzoate:H+ symporter BenE
VIDNGGSSGFGKQLHELASDAREIGFVPIATVPAWCIVGLIVYGLQSRPGESESRWNAPMAQAWFVLVVALAVPATFLLLQARKPGHWVSAVCGLALLVAFGFCSLAVFVSLSVD